MKRVIAIAAAGMAMGALSASAGNITINDTLGLIGNGIGGENGEVEPNCVWGQNWDMEAFLFDQSTKKLSMQGGYNMKTGEMSSGIGMMYSGDIFIDVNGDAVWGSTINADYSTDANGYFNVSNSKYKWDWAIVFGRTSYASDGGGGVLDGSYKVVNLQAGDPMDVEVYFDQNIKANPLRLAGNQGGNFVDKYTWNSFSDIDGTHYVLDGIDLNLISLTTGTTFTAHYTEGCGNDLLMGRTTSLSVPDGGLTVGMLGMGLSALGLASRRMRKN